MPELTQEQVGIDVKGKKKEELHSEPQRFYVKRAAQRTVSKLAAAANVAAPRAASSSMQQPQTSNDASTPPLPSSSHATTSSSFNRAAQLAALGRRKPAAKTISQKLLGDALKKIRKRQAETAASPIFSSGLSTIPENQQNASDQSIHSDEEVQVLPTQPPVLSSQQQPSTSGVAATSSVTTNNRPQKIIDTPPSDSDDFLRFKPKRRVVPQRNQSSTSVQGRKRMARTGTTTSGTARISERSKDHWPGAAEGENYSASGEGGFLRNSPAQYLMESRKQREKRRRRKKSSSTTSSTSSRSSTSKRRIIPKIEEEQKRAKK